jgi:hypothetical protein
MRLTAVFVLVVALVGCAGPIGHMREVPSGTAITTTPPPGKAAIVFLRPSTLGFAIASSVYELKPDGDVFVGIVPAKRKTVYFADPGTTRFMVVSEAADFMAADLEAGKTYYALVTPRMGVWKARFSLRPVAAKELDGTEFSDWFQECTFIENTPASRTWAKEHWSDIQEKKVEYLKKWDAKAEKPHLRATDGR